MMLSVSDIVYTLVSSVVTLFPVMNPIGNGLIINGKLTRLTEQQRVVAIKKIALYTLLIGIGSLVLGHFMLLLFGLAVPVIQLGGGIVICKSAIQWLSDSPESASEKEEIGEVNMKRIEMQLFYPLSFPMCFGPGSMSVVFTLMATASVKGDFLASAVNYLLIGFAILVMVVILYVFFKQSPMLMKKLGTTGNLIINKLLSFFMLCIGIQILIRGISAVFGVAIHI